MDVCRSCGVELASAHRALGDARATAQVLTKVAADASRSCSPARVFDVAAPYSSRTLQREMVRDEPVPMPYLARLASSVHHYGEQGATLAYLDLLDWALADLVISDDEKRQLLQLASSLGLSSGEVAAAHRRYVNELIAAASRDEVVTDEELDLLHRTAHALGVPTELVDDKTAALRPDSGGVTLQAGMTVCFTGSATHHDGSELPRKKLKEIATSLGLEPVGSVTKSNCDLLVAADTASRSGKAGKARKYGIPMVDVHDFLRAQPGTAVPALTTE